ncbi:hypothetical protein F2P81_006893 [Scophthalmus maximus]|uniref:Uncharacterized protein n=1 Tax=Scophthalmus maximus TaxID=52904 RepID=A0A6A4T775_SCOMX|nr:hypothetical protein F2P81_006893 [Scophthalmus maximus]
MWLRRGGRRQRSVQQHTGESMPERRMGHKRHTNQTERQRSVFTVCDMNVCQVFLFQIFISNSGGSVSSDAIYTKYFLYTPCVVYLKKLDILIHAL